MKQAMANVSLLSFDLLSFFLSFANYFKKKGCTMIKAEKNWLSVSLKLEKIHYQLENFNTVKFRIFGPIYSFSF